MTKQVTNLVQKHFFSLLIHTHQKNYNNHLYRDCVVMVLSERKFDSDLIFSKATEAHDIKRPSPDPPKQM